jgi:hypothetical protein
LVLTFLVTGVTVTNIVVPLSVFLVSRLSTDRSWRHALAATTILGILSGGTAIGLSVVCQRIMNEGGRPTEKTEWVVKEYLRSPSLERSLRYGVALANSVVAVHPKVMPNLMSKVLVAEGKTALDVQFGYDTLPLTACTGVRTLLILGLVGLGSWYGWRADVRYRSLAIPAVLVLAYNGVLHTFWGTELILYSMHWHAALLMLLAGWSVRSSPTGARVLLILGLVSWACATLVIRDMLLVLERAAA